MIRRRLEQAHLARYLAAGTLLLLLPSAFTGLAGDDYIHWIRAATGYPSGSHFDLFDFASGAPGYARLVRDTGMFPWFGLPDLRLAFFRPLTSLSHYVDYNAWPHLPFVMHVENIAIYAALVVAATRLYRRVVPAPWTAAFAALLYAIDPGHGTIGWVASRNGFLAAALGVAALVAHDRWRRPAAEDSRESAARAFAGPALFAIALLAGEAGIGAFAYLLAYAVTLDPAPTKARRAASLLPYVAVLLVWQATYRAQGYGAYGSAHYVDPGREPVRFLADLPGRAAALIAAQLVYFPAEIHIYLSPLQVGGLVVATAGLVGALAWIAWPLLREKPEARFFALGASLALAPVCAVFASSRNLQFVGLGVLGLLALVAAAANDPTTELVPRARAGATRVASKAIVLLHVVAAPLLFVAFSVLPASTAAWVDRVSPDLPRPDDLAGRTVVIVNSPMFLLSELRFFLPLDGALNGLHGRLLSSTTDTVTVTRTADDAITLRARDLMGEPWTGLVRDDAHAMTVGQSFDVQGMGARVDGVTPNGHPAAATFRFDAPLEDPRYAFFGWDHGRFVRVTPPAVGAEVELGRN